MRPRSKEEHGTIDREIYKIYEPSFLRGGGGGRRILLEKRGGRQGDQRRMDSMEPFLGGVCFDVCCSGSSIIVMGEISVPMGEGLLIFVIFVDAGGKLLGEIGGML